ncbi:MAG: pilus assembly protein PilC [Nitrospirae bacterium RBG_16_43_11]|nr:MAG: pilus assembly protein PilC [Nitrospirae bacterium RBG_16_43_11]
METYVWIGKTRDGKRQKGELAAKNKDEVISIMRKQNIMITSVTTRSKKLSIKLPFGSKVGDKDIAVFTRQFATMIDAGLPLVQCLDILSKQADNKTFASAINDIRQDVEAGSTYADALKKHPAVFGDLYVNMVAAGELGGILDTILNRLSKYIEKNIRLKRQVKAALFYPATIVAVAFIVIVVLLVYVIPIFAKMFTDFGGTLPAPTRMVIGASNFMRSNILIIIGILAAAIFGARKYYKTQNGRLVVDNIVLKMPVFGMLARKISVANFTRTLGTLISSGVPILDGLEIVAKTSGNKVVENAIYATRQSISEGKTLSEPLETTKVFPPMVVQMIAVGETTGALDAMLSKIADFYDEEVDSTVGILTSLLEPILMIFLGIVIGFIVVAMYLPIFKMAGTIG